MKFLKNFKKNEIVIYAIALMLVTAGYFNYTTNIDGSSLETYSESINELSDEYANIGDARLVNSNDVRENENTKDSEELNDNEVIGNSDDINEENSSEEVNNNDYFINSKLERDTNFASMISTYTKILEDNSISETEKAIAMKEITKINNNKNAISICENLISTKGFTNCIVFVNQDSVNVVVSLEGELSADKVAKIQNIISREFNCDIKDIHITEKQ